MDRLRYTVLSRTLPSKTNIETMDARSRKYVFHGYIMKLPNTEPCRSDDDCINNKVCVRGVCTGINNIVLKNGYENWIRKRLIKNYPEMYWGHQYNIGNMDYNYNYDYT
jgi:hypothetical protein